MGSRVTLDIAEDARFSPSCPVEVGMKLEIHPEGLGGSEVLSEAKGGCGSDPAATVDNLVDALIGHMEGIS
jgi:hypothetical protein